MFVSMTVLKYLKGNHEVEVQSLRWDDRRFDLRGIAGLRDYSSSAKHC
jgi:hypothetical protein